MKKLNLQTQILEVLKADIKDGGSGLSVREIAKKVYGYGYIRTTAYQLEKTISQRMCAVLELAAENGTVVFAKRIAKNPKTPEIKSRISLWKIFVPGVIGMNEEFADELMFKKKNGEAHTRTFKRMLSIASEQDILSIERIKELTI